MAEHGPTDAERLKRLRDLSHQISAALAEMLAFQTQVNAALAKIERIRPERLDGRGRAASRSKRTTGGESRRRGRRAA